MTNLQTTPSEILTINDLGLRSFNLDKKTGIVKSVTSEKCLVAKSIPFEQFLISKEPGRRSRAIPYSGHQIMKALMHYVEERTGVSTSFGQVFVYRDTMSHPGFVSKITPETTDAKMLMPTTPISDLVFERFIGTLDIMGNSEAGARIALKYEEDKLELALGTNIKVCENFNIFGGKRIATQRGFSYESLIEQVKEWLDEIETHFASDLETISILSKKEIERPAVHQYLGEMLELYQENRIVLPITDISALTAKIVEKGQIKSYWDLTQAGTEVIRFDSSAGSSTLETIEKWNSFMLSKI